MVRYITTRYNVWRGNHKYKIPIKRLSCKRYHLSGFRSRIIEYLVWVFLIELNVLYCVVIVLIIPYNFHPFNKIRIQGMAFRFRFCRFILIANLWQTEVKFKGEATQHRISIGSFGTITLIHQSNTFSSMFDSTWKFHTFVWNRSL